MNKIIVALFLVLSVYPLYSLGLNSMPEGPTQYILNKAPTTVKIDTVTPANNLPMPVQLYDQTGIAGDAGNPLYVQGAITATNPSVGTIPNPVPSSATYAGAEDPSGDLQGLKVNAGGALIVDGSAVTQPVSAASLPLPSGAATSANQTTELASLASIDGKIVAVNTGAVVVSSSALPTGASTEATLSALNAKFGSLGQTNMAGSAPVVIASDQSAIPASQSGVWNITNVSGTVSLPTGASTEATLSTLNGKVANDYGAASGAVRAAAQVGNASGVADFNSGNVSAQTLRVVVATDQAAIATTEVAPTAKTVKQAAVTVGTSAVRITTDGNAPDSDRVLLQFQPTADTTTARFFYGSSSVTSSGASRGIEIFPAQTVELKNDAGEYYIISDTAAQTVFITEQE